MADEPRRSGRATKGQHTKAFEVPDGPTMKRKVKGQPKTKQNSSEPTPAAEDEEIIRCICGTYEEEEETERDMICCDSCEAWQHNDCMEVTEVPDKYYCEQCRPDLHQDLLEKVARGEKPWEERAKKRDREAEEHRARKKKGGKKGGRKSTGKPTGDTKSDASEDVAGAGTPAQDAPVPEAKPVSKPVTPTPVAGNAQKRKADDVENGVKAEQGSKKPRKSTGPPTKDTNQKNGVAASDRRKSSAPPVPPPQGLKAPPAQNDVSGSPADLVNGSRKKAAIALVKVFQELATTERSEGSLELPEGETVQNLALRLGMELEYHMYHNLCGGLGNPTSEYSAQLRTIIFNVKKNPALRDQVLEQSLSTFALSTMNTDDMASKELQQKTAQMKKDADKQHVLVQETGPRIRRTHKGEEFVGDENQNISESIFPTNVPRRRESGIDDGGPGVASPGAMSPASPTFPNDAAEHSSSKPKPHAINTGASSRPSAGPERKSSTSFNIQDVWSSVQSPDTDRHPAVQPPPALFREPPSSANVQPDAEIDQLLKDEDVESEPYSPKEFNEEGVVWQGKIAMPSVATFSAIAKFAAGANLSPRFPWDQLLPSTLQIDGRIDVERASKYLCGLQYSQTTDITVVGIKAPENVADREQFDKLFNYFLSRKRYGVIGTHPLPSVKDTYIIPVEVGEGVKPEFLSLLQNNSVEDPNPDRILLVAIAIKSRDPSSANATPQQPDSATHLVGSPASAIRASPAIPQSLQFSPVQGYNGQNSPQPPPYGSPAQHTLQYSPPIHGFQSSPMTGAAAAVHVLGPMAKAPAVEQLLVQAPQAGIPEFNVVRDVLINVPNAANDLALLTSVLEQKKNGDV